MYSGILLGSRIKLQSDFDKALRSIVFKLVVLNVSLLVQYFGDLLLDVRGRYLNNTMRSLDGISQSG
jgi:hypothetical protein